MCRGTSAAFWLGQHHLQLEQCLTSLQSNQSYSEGDLCVWQEIKDVRASDF